MKVHLLLISVLSLATSCASAVSEDVLRAKLYFPPEVKYVEEPSFSFSSAERKKALLEYRDHGADTLFELIIDAEGKVVRSRLIRTNVDPVYHQDLEDHAAHFEFTSDADGSMYRAFYYPVDYRHRTTFEWL